MKPYGLAADLHLHAWKGFGSTDEKGINTRLIILLRELVRLWQETDKAGGKLIVLAGDIFHVRGTISPSVLNPVRGALRALRKKYPHIEVLVLAGNHDMEFRESSEVGNAVEALDIEGFTVVNQPFPINDDDYSIYLVPWIEDLAKLKVAIETVDADKRVGLDLIIHAPIDGVIPGIPPHGLTAGYLAALGYRRVFAGHYHHHKDFGSGVYSIGALAHHTWSDVGTKAGFLIVGKDVERFDSTAPKFVDIDSGMSEKDVELIAPGNYIRAKTSSTKTKDLNELRAWLEKLGAKAVLVQHVPEASVTREKGAAASAAVASTLEASVAGFVSASFKEKDQADRINKQCQVILAEANAC